MHPCQFQRPPLHPDRIEAVRELPAAINRHVDHRDMAGKFRGSAARLKRSLAWETSPATRCLTGLLIACFKFGDSFKCRDHAARHGDCGCTTEEGTVPGARVGDSSRPESTSKLDELFARCIAARFAPRAVHLRAGTALLHVGQACVSAAMASSAVEEGRKVQMPHAVQWVRHDAIVVSSEGT